MAEPSAMSGAPQGASDAEKPWRTLLFAQWVTGHRRLVVLVVLSLSMALAIGVFRLTLSGDYEAYFDDADPQLEALNRLYAVFARNDNLLFAVESRDGDIFQVATLEGLRDLTEAAWKLPFAVRVDSIINFQHIDSRDDEVIIEELIGPDGITGDEALDAIRAKTLSQRALVGRLIDAKGRASGVAVQLELVGNRHEAVLSAARAARALARRFEREHPHLQVQLSGNVMLNAAFPEASVRDLKALTPLMYLTMFVLVAVLLRSWRSAILTMVVVVGSCVIAMGFAGWVGFSITSALVAAPTIITTVAVAGCVHLLTTMQRGCAAGLSPSDAMQYSLTVNMRAMLVTTLTTFIGFMSLNSSDAPPFRDLGTVTAVGVVAAFTLSVLFLPALMGSTRRGNDSAKAPVVRLEWISQFIINHRALALSVVLLIALVAVVVMPRMTLNDAFVTYFDKSVEFRRDTDRIMEQLTGIYQLEYMVDSGTPYGIHDPEYLDALARFVDWLQTQPEVMHINSLVDVMKRLNQHVGRSEYALPTTREAAAQYLLLYETSVPYGLDLNARLSVDKNASRVTATLENLDNVTLRALEARARQWIAANVTDPAIEFTATGTALMFAHIAERNIRAMIRGGAVAVLIIAVALALVFRSVRLGLLSLLPNLLPGVIAFGVWALLVGEMGIALAIVAAMTLGIVVDDTVHFVTHFLHARRRLRAEPEAALRYAFTTTGAALVTTTVVLSLGFAVLSFSAYQVNHGMGQLSALVIVCALAADFLMLPQLLTLACRKGWI